MRARLHLAALAALAAAGCAARPPASQVIVGGQPVTLQQLTPAEVAGEVRIVPRGEQVFFQGPSIQTTKIIDLHQAGKEMGISLGKVERIRFGYLFGVLDRASGAMKQYVLFQSNFVEGNDRYASVALADGRTLSFTVSRAPDPCVPNCFPVVEALIAEIPDAVLRASAAAGLQLHITLDNGVQITANAVPAYVQGYLDAVDAYRRES